MAKEPAQERTWTCPSQECGGKQVKALGNRIKAAVAGHLSLAHGMPRDELLAQGDIEQWDLSALRTESASVLAIVPTGPREPSSEVDIQDGSHAAAAAAPEDLETRVGALEQVAAAQSSQHGMCTDPRCSICRGDKVTLAQEGMAVGRLEFMHELDEAAARYGLEPQRDMLGEAVHRLRMEKSEAADEEPQEDLVRITG